MSRYVVLQLPKDKSDEEGKYIEYKEVAIEEKTPGGGWRNVGKYKNASHIINLKLAGGQYRWKGDNNEPVEFNVRPVVR